METDTKGPRQLGLCVLCGLPAAGKSTFARVLAHWLRRERGWAVGVLSYDDILPDALLDGAGAGPPVSWEGEGRGLGSLTQLRKPTEVALFLMSKRVCTRPNLL